MADSFDLGFDLQLAVHLRSMGAHLGLPLPGLARGRYNNCVRKGPRGWSFHTTTATNGRQPSPFAPTAQSAFVQYRWWWWWRWWR